MGGGGGGGGRGENEGGKSNMSCNRLEWTQIQ